MGKHKTKPLFYKYKTMLLLVMFSFIMINTSAASVQIQGKVIKVNENNVNLNEFIWKLKKLTGYEFVCDSDDLSEYSNVSIKKQGSIEQIFDEVLKDTDLTYYSEGDIYVIKKKEVIESTQPEAKILTGKVLDKTGASLPGVSVIIENTTLGTSTGIDGDYILAIPAGTVNIVFSFIGMETQIVRYSGQESMDIVLQESSLNIDEVVITGYQQINKRKLASSVTTVNSKQLEKIKVASIDKMLEGQLSGVSVIGNTSTPGVAAKVRIRGASSISGNREPIWVVDGVILQDPVKVTAAQLNSADYLNKVGNAIQSINPSDIARIDVLKDASATAIYGVKAANGVIVITTKSGKKGKPQITFSTQHDVVERPSYESLNLMNSKERVDISREIIRRSLLNTSTSDFGYENLYRRYTRKEISLQQFNQEIASLETTNEDWFKHLFRNALNQRYNLSISGGSDYLTYYFSLGYNKENAPFIKGGNDKLNLMSKFNYKVNDRLTMGLQIRNSVNEKTFAHKEVHPYDYAYNTSRTIPSYKNGERFLYANKNINNFPTQYNFLNEIENSEKTIDLKDFNLNYNLNYKILDGLQASLLLSMGKSQTNEEEWASENTLYMWNERNLPSYVDLKTELQKGSSRAPIGGEISNKSLSNESYIGRLQLNYNKTFNEHSIDLISGFEISNNKLNGVATVQRGYLPSYGKKAAGIDLTEYPEYAKWLSNNPNIITDAVNRTISVYAALTYSYKNRYILNGNIRKDGANKFGQNENDRFNNVWSASARWNLSQEEFMSSLSWLNISLKGSYGIQGNVVEDVTPNLITRVTDYDYLTGRRNIKIDSYPNPNLKWEKTTSYNFGFSYMLFNKVRGSVEYYMKKGSDMLIRIKAPRISGSDSHYLNSGTMENKGIEWNLGVDVINSDDFTFNVNLNGFHNENKITKSNIEQYQYTDYINGTIIRKGIPVGGFYSYKFDKLDKNGLPTFKDTEQLEGETQEEFFKRVFVYSGTSNPTVTGGLSLNFTYKYWFATCLFNYSFGSKIRLPKLYDNAPGVPSSEQNFSKELNNRWREPGDEEHTNIPGISDELGNITSSGYTFANDIWEMYNYSDIRVVKGDYLRLKSVSIGYNIPTRILEKVKLQAASLTVNFSNLWLLADKRLKGHDPSVATYGNKITPPLFGMGVGLNINF
ncbi:MAG: SusC/RagA family TonB-linked outer membrane protein [Bacteroidales bacterium]|nr:SusC/RagA family TonB-linked outer membrane protein [Bacteroidales bacterium]